MSQPATAEMPSVGDFARVFRRIQAEIHKVIVGHEQAVEELLMAFFAGGGGICKGLYAFSWRHVVSFVGSESLVTTFCGVHEIHQ